MSLFVCKCLVTRHLNMLFMVSFMYACTVVGKGDPGNVFRYVTVVLTILTLFGGLLVNLHKFPEWWRQIIRLNPVCTRNTYSLLCSLFSTMKSEIIPSSHFVTLVLRFSSLLRQWSTSILTRASCRMEVFIQCLYYTYFVSFLINII
jgi:hypothetical protein